MEKITMIYEGNYDENDLTRIEMMVADKEDRGLRDYDVCSKFKDFMNAIGFSENNVLRYFRGDDM